MAEGWLFRLRTSLGAQHAAPAWPVSREVFAPPDGAVVLRRPPASERAAPCSGARDAHGWNGGLKPALSTVRI